MGTGRWRVVVAVVSTLAGLATAGEPRGAARVTGVGPPGYVHFTFDDDASGQTWEVAQLLANNRIPATFFLDVDKLRLLTKDESDTLFTAIASEPEQAGLFLTEPAARARGGSIATLEELSALSREMIVFFRADARISGESRRALASRVATEVNWSITTADLGTADPELWGSRVIERIAHANGGVVRIHTAATNQPALISALVAALDRENCKRRAARTSMLVAAPIDFFIRDGRKARAVTAEAKASVAAYLEALDKKCVVLLNDSPERMNDIQRFKQCLDNPLGRGCG